MSLPCRRKLSFWSPIQNVKYWAVAIIPNNNRQCRLSSGSSAFNTVLHVSQLGSGRGSIEQLIYYLHRIDLRQKQGHSQTKQSKIALAVFGESCFDDHWPHPWCHIYKLDGEDSLMTDPPRDKSTPLTNSLRCQPAPLLFHTF